MRRCRRPGAIPIALLQTANERLKYRYRSKPCRKGLRGATRKSILPLRRNNKNLCGDAAWSGTLFRACAWGLTKTRRRALRQI